jgi:hypothetical protein
VEDAAALFDAGPPATLARAPACERSGTLRFSLSLSPQFPSRFVAYLVMSQSSWIGCIPDLVALQSIVFFSVMLLGFKDKVQHGCPFPPRLPSDLASMCFLMSRFNTH